MESDNVSDSNVFEPSNNFSSIFISQVMTTDQLDTSHDLQHQEFNTSLVMSSPLIAQNTRYYTIKRGLIPAKPSKPRRNCHFKTGITFQSINNQQSIHSDFNSPNFTIKESSLLSFNSSNEDFNININDNLPNELPTLDDVTNFSESFSV